MRMGVHQRPTAPPPLSIPPLKGEESNKAAP